MTASNSNEPSADQPIQASARRVVAASSPRASASGARAVRRDIESAAVRMAQTAKTAQYAMKARVQPTSCCSLVAIG